METAATRDPGSWLHFLEGQEGFAPAGDVYLIVDGLPRHWGHAHFHFALPRVAA